MADSAAEREDDDHVVIGSGASETGLVAAAAGSRVETASADAGAGTDVGTGSRYVDGKFAGPGAGVCEPPGAETRRVPGCNFDDGKPLFSAATASDKAAREV